MSSRHHPRPRLTNDGDLDWGTGDGFPDWADGFNAFAPDPRDDLMLEGRNPDAKRFVPVRITLPAVPYGSGKLWFEYDASDPVYDPYSVAVGAHLNPDKTNWGDPKLRPLPTAATTVRPALPELTQERSDDYLLFVHGWRMRDWERQSFAATGFKRSWWAGHEGGFGLFSWPTEWVDLNGSNLGNSMRAAMDSGNFNRSEEIAWNSAPALHNLLAQLRSETEGKLGVMAHSMGNIVTSEALRLAGNNQVVDTYVMSQSAVSAHLYSGSYPTATAANVGKYVPFVGDAGGNLPRFVNINQAAGEVINYFNGADFALDNWLTWNNRFRGGSYFGLAQPGFHNLQYTNDGTQAWRYDAIGSSRTAMVKGTDDYEMFAHALNSYTPAIGAQGGLLGPIAGEENLNNFPHAFGGLSSEHSAQFQSTSAKRFSCWEKLLQDMNM